MSNNRTTESDRFAGMFKALANTHRLNIFMRLISCCGAGNGRGVDPEKMKTCVGQLGRDLGIVPSTVSHHIKELRQAGLIDMERNGQKIFCRVDPATLKTLSSFFVELQESSENNSGKTKKTYSIKGTKNE